MIQFPWFYLHYNTVLMIVNFGSENLVGLPDVGSGFCPFPGSTIKDCATCPFPIFSNTTGNFGLKVGQHISSYITSDSIKVSKGAKIRNRYNQVPHLTQDTKGKVTNSQKTPQTRAKRSALSQQVTTKHI